MINRREALRRTAMLMGGALSAPAIMGVLKGCKAEPTVNWKPEFFSAKEAPLISQVAEIIIPKTDTPGAIEAGVPGFIDKMLKDVYSPEEQGRFMDAMRAFNERAEKETGDTFIDLDGKEQTAFVNKLHKEAVEAVRADPKQPRPFIMLMKELTMLGFFTSEAGATQVLQYMPVPGAYKGCIPLSEAGNGKTWAI
jgi:gluconate 2-dehydrogenase gamma chain